MKPTTMCFIILLLLTLQPFCSSTLNGEPSLSKEPETEMGWAHSVVGLRILADLEFQMQLIIAQWEEEWPTQHYEITSWLNDFEESSVKGTAHLSSQKEVLEEIASHPFMALRMIRRFVSLKKNLPKDFALYDFLNIEREFTLPQLSDFEHAMDGIINLRHVYKLRVDDIMTGLLAGIHTGVGLTQRQVHEVALHAEKTSAFTEALLWLQPLMDQNCTLRRQDGSIELNSTVLQSDVERISRNHDQIIEKLTDANFWDVEHRFTSKILGGCGSKKLMTLTESIGFDDQVEGPPLDYIKFLKLCHGDTLLTETENEPPSKSSLVCFYERESNPAWLIGPLKIEVYSWDPYVIRIYNAINETIRQQLYLDSQSLLKPEVVPLNFLGKDESGPHTKEAVKTTRTTTRMTFDNRIVLEDMESRIERMSGFDLTWRIRNTTGERVEAKGWSSEIMVLVASYAPGGHYELHVDHVPEQDIRPQDGPLMATFMIFLNNVRLGGQTVFPQIGLIVKPIKNSAILWFNLLRNGNFDERLTHGACPVVLGQKWIANSWIRSFANFQKRKCSLNPEE